MEGGEWERRGEGRGKGRREGCGDREVGREVESEGKREGGREGGRERMECIMIVCRRNVYNNILLLCIHTTHSNHSYIERN